MVDTMYTHLLQRYLVTPPHEISRCPLHFISFAHLGGEEGQLRDGRLHVGALHLSLAVEGLQKGLGKHRGGIAGWVEKGEEDGRVAGGGGGEGEGR